MNNLKVNNWQDWEEICKSLMSYLVKKNHNIHVQYVNYGSPGQKQHGVDIIPNNSSAPSIVAQCKLIQGLLTWDVISAEMDKTNKYPGSIDRYCRLTTGKRDTLVQDRLNQGFTYRRPNGTEYVVSVFYWDEISPKDIIPLHVLHDFFPELFPLNNPVLNNEYLLSLVHLKKYIPTIITSKDLHWLENWNFSCGYIIEHDYQPFDDLYIEHDRTNHGLNGISEWLHTNSRAEIAKTLPAANRFFNALSEFRKSINSDVAGKTNKNGIWILSIEDYSSFDQQRITTQWKHNARYLAEVYRQDIMGESQY